MKYLGLAFSVLLGSFAAMPSARAHEDEVPPKQLGEVAFANSCAAQAQESFERGVALLHSFGFADGAQAFREALDRDPTCAIANWGIAAILIGNTFSVGPTQEGAHAALAAIDRGRAIGAKTERERDYIEAIAAYYDHFAERSHAARMRSLADAFEALAQRYVGRRRNPDLQRALPDRHPIADRQELCPHPESGGDSRNAVRQAS